MRTLLPNGTNADWLLMIPQARHILAPHVPTPSDVVERMLQLAELTDEDVVYDLGCGDGRIVIAAAKGYGARGVGVDIEPYWVAQSLANAQAAGVSALVRFEHQDALSIDQGSRRFHHAGVICPRARI